MASSVKAQKVLLRARLLETLWNLGKKERKERSRKIFKKAVRHPLYRSSESILSYVSFRTEVETDELIRRALKDGKRVFVPLIRPGKKIHIYRVVNLKKDLRKGAYGIPEPRPVRLRLGEPSKLDLIFVPGLGFDRKGRRLGRGGGYFDRFLSRAKTAKRIGLAFRKQIVSKIPVEKHDLPVHALITD